MKRLIFKFSSCYQNLWRYLSWMLTIENSRFVTITEVDSGYGFIILCVPALFDRTLRNWRYVPAVENLYRVRFFFFCLGVIIDFISAVVVNRNSFLFSKYNSNNINNVRCIHHLCLIRIVMSWLYLICNNEILR